MVFGLYVNSEGPAQTSYQDSLRPAPKIQASLKSEMIFHCPKVTDIVRFFYEIQDYIRYFKFFHGINK